MPYNPPGYYPQYYPNANPYADQLTQLKSTQQMYTPQIMQPTQPVSNNSALLWVQGEAGAKSYLVAPNTTVLLMDSEGERFYIKSTDQNGIPSMRVFAYSEVTNAAAHVQPVQVDHVTHEELNSLREEFKTEMQRITELMTKKPTKRGAIETDE